MSIRWKFCLGASLVCIPLITMANTPTSLKVDQVQVKQWNQFADDLLALHQAQLEGKKVRTQSETGGYATHPAFYVETRYYDADTDQLLSRVQRERKHPERIHLIAVNVYNEQQRLTRDYLAVYLPEYRNAPIQTLINLHAYSKDLHAFRQWDASGERIYEQCQARTQGNKILISLDEDELAAAQMGQSKILDSSLYQHCFDTLPIVADEFLQPGRHADDPKLLSLMSRSLGEEDVQTRIDVLSRLLEAEPANTNYLVQRGNFYFLLHDFDLAILDYSDALHHDPQMDEAYFGRGMALARNGQVTEGIADLSVYISHHPRSSVAYTKRGVRYLWGGENNKAEADFRRALQLNPKNAEAHDDLGVIHARRGEYAQAIDHFTQTLRIDPTYLKARHNLAMVYYIKGENVQALASINKVLVVTPQARDSLLLKAEILQQLGQVSDAQAIKLEAEFLPEGNWSEHLAIE